MKRLWLVVNRWTGHELEVLAAGARDALVQMQGWVTEAQPDKSDAWSKERYVDEEGWLWARDWRVRKEPLSAGQAELAAAEERLRAAAEVGWHGGL